MNNRAPRTCVCSEQRAHRTERCFGRLHKGSAAHSLPAVPVLWGTPHTSGAHPTASDEEGMLRCGSRARCHRNTAHPERTFMPLLPSSPASQLHCITPLGAASLSKKSTYGHTIKQSNPSNPDPSPAGKCLLSAGCRRGSGGPAEHFDVLGFCPRLEKSQLLSITPTPQVLF